MALCVALQSDGSLLPTGEVVGECTGYVLVSGSEYGVYQVVQDAFGVPTTEQAVGWFVGSFALVMTLYVVGRCAGSIPRMFR